MIDTRSENLFEFKNYGFIGYQLDNNAIPFSGTDSENLYNRNLTDMAGHPDFSYYINNPISYARNSLGHRSCEPSFIINTKKHYVLVVGDSFTEGTGLHYQDTYGSKIAEKTGLPVYNLGLAGTGNDTILHNLVAWRNFMPQAPKILIMQWTQDYRTASIDTTTNLITGTSSLDGPDSPTVDIVKFIDSGLNIGAFTTRAIMAETLIRELYKQSEIINVHVPGWEVKHYGKNRSVSWRPTDNSHIDFARDMQHRGRAGHEELATNILKLFNKFK